MKQDVQPLISMSARAVVAAGSRFAAFGGVYHDAGVALDEISSLTSNVEPVVLRVSMRGGSAADRASVAGDWLCPGGDPPRMIPAPRWTYVPFATRSKTWLGAWERCEVPELMLYEAAWVGVDARPLVLAACACARTASHRIPRGDGRPMIALESAEAWARGESSAEEALSAANAVLELRGNLGDAFRYPAYAAMRSEEGAIYAEELAYAVAAVSAGGLRARRKMLADVVRAKVRTLDVLRAAVTHG